MVGGVGRGPGVPASALGAGPRVAVPGPVTALKKPNAQALRPLPSADRWPSGHVVVAGVRSGRWDRLETSRGRRPPRPAPRAFGADRTHRQVAASAARLSANVRVPPPVRSARDAWHPGPLRSTGAMRSGRPPRSFRPSAHRFFSLGSEPKHHAPTVFIIRLARDHARIHKATEIPVRVLG